MFKKEVSVNDQLSVATGSKESYQRKIKIIGMAVVAVVVSGFVAIAGVSLMVAGIAAVGGIIAVNFVPMVAKWAALRKERLNTTLVEDFSEETIRRDERQEAQRVEQAEQAYKTLESELNGSIEELREQLENANETEKSVIEGQIQQLMDVIGNQFRDLARQQEDLKELRRVNGLLIAIDRGARALQKAQQAERNPAQRQDLITARQAIKTRMRAALAGQRVDHMRREIHGSNVPSANKVAQITEQHPERVPVTIKEKQHALPHNR